MMIRRMLATAAAALAMTGGVAVSALVSAAPAMAEETAQEVSPWECMRGGGHVEGYGNNAWCSGGKYNGQPV
ncbi:hypothetical protein L3Q67_38325 [Saccharothrix sp. AJ9571]|nr:hypothetical protein L3Q67_38325 [Saccharothrix sp. AJ9571]